LAEIIGTITRLQSGFYTVHIPDGVITCQLRGRLKQVRQQETIAAVGDHVIVTAFENDSGVIEEILPREKSFFRLAPSARGAFKQVLLANPDLVCLVFACDHPSPSFRMLDRFLIITEKQQIPQLIVANKLDLVGRKKAESMFAIYTKLGYRVVFTSAEESIAIEELHACLLGKITAFSGPSGVGKSSLLNRIQPGLGLEIGALKDTQARKGKHTTVVRELFELKGGGFVADMPGLRSLSLWDTQPEELDAYFPELRDLVAGCQFSNCSHLSEPGCAVKLAVAKGTVSSVRYESYIRLRAGDG
jgi:ribosome biogenesis GTPase